jgi:hypothetical protein
VNPYSAPTARNTETAATPSVASGPTRLRAVEVLLPAIIFPAGYLATAGAIQWLNHGPSSGLDRVKTLVLDFRLLLLTIVFSYAILRTILICRSWRPSIWFTFFSAVLAYILLPFYWTPIYLLLLNVLTPDVFLFSQGLAYACAGIAIDAMVSVMVNIVRQGTPRRNELA